MSIQFRDKKTGRIKKSYTKEQEDFIREVYPKIGGKKTVVLFNEKFGTDINGEQIQSKARRLGVKYRNNRQWSECEIEYLKEICVGQPIDDTVRMMIEKFHVNFTKESIKSQMRRYGLACGVPYGYEKGSRSIRRAPIGTITFSKFAGKTRRLFIKISDDPQEGSGLNKKNWKPYKDYVWEQHHGEIPKTHFVVCADGNERNCDISNLRCIPWKYVQNLTRYNKWYGKGADMLDCGIAWCDLNEELKRLGCKLEDEKESD